MGAIGLNPIRLDRIGLDPIRINAIKLGVPGASGSDRPYIDPEVLASLKAVCICYGKSNDDPDRAVVKNLVDPDNPFVISNAAYEGMSGYNGYPVVFGANKTWEQMPTGTFIWNIDDNKLHITKALIAGNGLLFSYVKLNGSLLNVKEIPSFKIKVSGLEGKSKLWYRYLKTEDAISETTAVLENGTHELPKSYIPSDSLHDGVWIGFAVSPISEGVKEFDCDITIEVLSEYEGAFVTDGIDDLITSTKTVQEMLGGSNEITVVSMIHQIGLGCRTNFICDKGSYWRCNEVANTGEGKTGIYGYSSTNISVNTPNIINNVLGDKVDYSVTGDRNDLTPSQFSVVGYISSSGKISYTSSVAWFWTIIANKVLTTDQINQVIAYFNLDRTLKPDILCNTIKQGITNENHAEFGDRLIDFSGNGRDIQLNNIAWKGDSGIGKYEVDFLDSSIWTSSNSTITSSKIDCKNAISHIMLLYYNVGDKEYPDIPSFKIIKTGADIDYSYIDETGSPKSVKIVDGVNVLPASHNTLYSGSGRFCGFGNPGIGNSVIITQIPSHAGALCLDGVNDFGKVTGMPIYKDYTVIADYIRISAKENAADAPILSKSKVINNGAFLFNYLNVSSTLNSYSFGTNNMLASISDSERKIYYQSKYVNEGKSINSGTGTDYDSMWLGTIRDNDSRFFNGAIYSLMSFPYSMSEFLIERQLKKHKLGTLYPDMVEWRPIYTSNTNDYTVARTAYFGEAGQFDLALGSHYSIGTRIRIYVKPNGAADEVTSIKVNGVELTYDCVDSNYGYAFNGTLSDKSPQKINITIDEYIRYEDIVQPYPSLFTLIDYDTEEVYSWGSKLKVGARFKSNVVNLLPNMYEWQGDVLYNGEVLNWGINPGVVAKEMVFSWNMPFKYLIDNNEPKCILSPRLLRIPNSSYKILGYIPDISGHGNNGVIHNSAYAEGSGVNEDGSYQLDGVDDFVTIPTLSSGGKQVLMKVNWNTINSIIYDQRGSGGFAIYCSDYNNPSDPIVPAYKGRNAAGTTYIDGIRNEYIIASQLRNVTHNIVEILDTSYAAGNINPIIGKSYMNSNYGSLALYDFMLFDNISTDDKIKELNEYVGIEGNVWGILTQLSNSTLISNETFIKNE